MRPSMQTLCAVWGGCASRIDDELNRSRGALRESEQLRQALLVFAGSQQSIGCVTDVPKATRQLAAAQTSSLPSAGLRP
jgi:hypothetical protein